MAGRNNSNLIVKFAVLCVIVILIFAVINIQIELNDLKNKKQDLIEQIGNVEDIIEEINIYLDAPITDEYIERVAREQLGYRKSGEIIFYNYLAN
ncbi:MAG: septum formation initiator family protein [Eubacteriales bacterium]|nr:septum formation initiator family protein [Eubacteriales bacterium]